MSLWLTKDDKNVILCQKRMGLPNEILRFAQNDVQKVFSGEKLLRVHSYKLEQ